MNPHNLVFLAFLLVPLSFDTFVLSAALGIAGMPKKRYLRTSFILTAFEAGMPLIGAIIGRSISSELGHFADYIAAALIGCIGILMIRPIKSRKGEDRRMKSLAHARGLTMVGLGIGVGLDQLSIGFGLGLLHISLILIVVYMAIQSFTASQLGFMLGARLSNSTRKGLRSVTGITLLLVSIGLIVLKLTGHQL